MADLKDLIVNGAARIIGKTYSSEFVGNVTGNADTATKASQDSEGNVIKDAYFKCSGGIIDGPLDVRAINNTQGSFDEGIRIAAGRGGYSTLCLGSSATSSTGTIDGQWWLGCNTGSFGRKLLIAHHGSEATRTYFYADSSDTVSPSLQVGGKITADELVGNLAASNITGTLGVGHGGTGIASFAAGDILYASGTSTLAALNKGTDGQVLKLSGGKPAWGTDNTPTKFAWTNGTTAGPTGSLTGNGMSAVNFAAIPSASESVSGIVTTEPQAFAGAKTFADTTDSTNNTSGAVIVSGGLGVAKNIYAAAVHNAVWNDLVDCMEVPEDTSLEFGYCYSWEGDSVIKSSRSSKNCIGIHSNTAGFVMGEKKTKTIQAAVAGFVLAYVDKLYPEGTPLTWGDNGTLTKCSLLKRVLHPERIIATFYKEEKEEKWHNLPVSGRHWVKVV